MNDEYQTINAFYGITNVPSGRDYIKIKLPELFVLILKKTYPDIVNVNVIEAETFQSYDIRLGKNTKVFIKLNLELQDTNLIKSKEEYDELISNLFKMTYPNFEFVSLTVREIKILRHDRFKEFMELFSI
jgi:hypothetical protein